MVVWPDGYIGAITTLDDTTAIADTLPGSPAEARHPTTCLPTNSS